jgi:hypothetical protein
MNRERARVDAEQGAGRQLSPPRILVCRSCVRCARFVMIRAVARGFLLVMIAVAARADTLDDAVAALAKRVSARLQASETVRVTFRNVSSLPAAEAAKAQMALARALQRRVRNPTQVELTLTISENLRGYLLVVEIRRENETVVEMEEFRPAPSLAKTALAPFTIESKLLWEQELPILDVARVSDSTLADSMLVLDTDGLIRYERREGKWERAAALELPVVVRDPRGRLETNGDSITIHEPGMICTVPTKMTTPARCEDGGQLKAARNTQDLHDWRGEFFASSELGGDTLVAEVDGRIHIYDAAHAPQAVFDGWGSDFAIIAACGGRHIAAAAAGDNAASDSIALFDVANRAPVRISEPLEFSGPITALWPAGDGAMAVARNLSTGRYAAYSLTLDCGH